MRCAAVVLNVQLDGQLIGPDIDRFQRQIVQDLDAAFVKGKG